MAADLEIITKTYDLILWSINHTAKFPRDHRHSLGARIEQQLYSLLEDLIEAKFTRAKADVLRRAGLGLEKLRYQFRLAKDLRILSLNSHRHAAILLTDIGRQLGGWRKRVEQ